MSTIWEMAFQLTSWLTCWFVNILYRLAFPVYVILDALANNLNDLRIVLVALDIKRGITKDDAAKSRGISLKDLEEDLEHASQLKDHDIEMAFLTALSIVVGILVTVVMCSRYLIGCF